MQLERSCAERLRADSIPCLPRLFRVAYATSLGVHLKRLILPNGSLGELVGHEIYWKGRLLMRLQATNDLGRDMIHLALEQAIRLQ